jgi:hypothetical protein
VQLVEHINEKNEDVKSRRVAGLSKKIPHLFIETKYFKLRIFIKLLWIKLGGAAEIILYEKSSDLGAQVALVDVAVFRWCIIKFLLCHFENTANSFMK